ncbi:MULTISPECIES: dienelactone hydrolase family protein [Actinoalloteichus]|uniref:dienelactone hydrolase family protein n=1 Tax=Actinoalloteichus TaxID=65496 RepID=UPI002989C38B|nr:MULTISPECIES: dienelactone hydrolase family protein [Actinoalloteichus]
MFLDGPARDRRLLREEVQQARPQLTACRGHRLVAELTAQVHLGLAEYDLTPEDLSELNQALDAAGISYTIETYPDTIHGYTMSDTDAFNPSALQRHWDRLLPLLDRTLACTEDQTPTTRL